MEVSDKTYDEDELVEIKQIKLDGIQAKAVLMKDIKILEVMKLRNTSRYKPRSCIYNILRQSQEGGVKLTFHEGSSSRLISPFEMRLIEKLLGRT